MRIIHVTQIIFPKGVHSCIFHIKWAFVLIKLCLSITFNDLDPIFQYMIPWYYIWFFLDSKHWRKWFIKSGIIYAFEWFPILLHFVLNVLFVSRFNFQVFFSDKCFALYMLPIFIIGFYNMHFSFYGLNCWKRTIKSLQYYLIELSCTVYI